MLAEHSAAVRKKEEEEEEEDRKSGWKLTFLRRRADMLTHQGQLHLDTAIGAFDARQAIGTCRGSDGDHFALGRAILAARRTKAS